MLRPPDYLLMQLQQQRPPPPPLPPPSLRLWQLSPWVGLLGNTALLSIPSPRVIQPPLPPRIQSPQIQLMFPDWGEWYPRRGGTRTDIAPPPQPTPPDLKTWLETQRIKDMPPGLRELYSAWLGAGRYAVITPALDVLTRWLRREDPTKGLEEFQTRATAASYASPWAHTVGQGVALAGLGGLMAQHLAARGATLGARGAVEQFLAGLRQTAKPAVAGGAAGAAAGAAVGAAAGRDPLAEAAKFGTLGALIGLGGVPRERLIAAGLLGGVVGGSTAKEYGATKGLEAGVAVFPLPIVAPERLARGVFAGLTAGRRPAARQETAPLREVPVEWVRLRRGMSVEEAASYASELRFDPAAQREFFTRLVEEALSRQRAGDVGALVQLRYFREWLDPASRMRFDEVLRWYGLAEVKHRAPEYGIGEEVAPAVARLFRRDVQRTPEYALREEVTQALNRLFRRDTQRVPEYFLRSEDATMLARLFRRDFQREPEYSLRGEDAAALARVFTRDRQRAPEYALTDEAAALLDQFLRMGDKTVLIFRRVPAEHVQIFRRRVRPADASRPGQEVWLVPSEASQIQLFRPRQTDRLELEGLTRQEYAVAPLAVSRQDQRQTYAVAPAVAAAQRTAQRTVARQTEVATTTTTTTTPGRTITTTPPPETPPRTPPPGVPPYIPPWMLNLPVSIALPLLAQMGLRLPPPPNPNMPLGAYLRTLRFPALGRQREVFVLI